MIFSTRNNYFQKTHIISLWYVTSVGQYIALCNYVEIQMFVFSMSCSCEKRELATILYYEQN